MLKNGMSLLMVILLMFLCSCAEQTVSGADNDTTVSSGETLVVTEDVSENSDVAEYYLPGIVPKDYLEGWSVKEPCVEFASVEELKLAIANCSFSKDQLSIIQYFPSDANGIRSIAPESIVIPTGTVGFGSVKDGVDWLGEYYAFSYQDNDIVGLYVGKKAYDMYYDWRHSAIFDNERLLNVEQTVELIDGVTKTIITYSTEKEYNGKYVLYDLQESNRMIHVIEKYSIGATGQESLQYVYAFLKWNSGIYMNINWVHPSNFSVERLKAIGYEEILLSTNTDVIE